MICLVSGQTLPNYRGIKEINPTEIVYLYSSKTKHQLKILKGLKQIPSKEYQIDPYDIKSIENLCTKLLDKKPQSEWILNMTGGTKVSSLACFRIFDKRKLPVIYVDSENKQLLYIYHDRTEYKVFNKSFSISEIIRAHGQKIGAVDSSKFNPVIRENILNEIFRLHSDNKFQKFIKKIPEKIKKGESDNYHLKINGGQISKHGNKFELSYANTILSNIPGNDPDILTTTGQWFEEYTYLLLNRSKLFDDVKLRVKIDWQRANPSMPKNEMDIVLVKNDTLYIVECKSGKVLQDDVNKLKNYKELFGGSFCISVLVSYFNISNPMKEKLIENNIAYFEDYQNINNLAKYVSNLEPYQV